MTSSPAPESVAVPEIEVQYPDEQLAARMGIEITEWAPDRVVGTMPVAGNRQPFGLLHGGANGVLAETLGSTAAASASTPSFSRLGYGWRDSSIRESRTAHRQFPAGRRCGRPGEPLRHST